MRKKEEIESQDTDDFDIVEVGIEGVVDRGHETETSELIEQVIDYVLALTWSEIQKLKDDIQLDNASKKSKKYKCKKKK